jgi:hypothetical protein
MAKDKTLTRKYYFPQKERDLNTMDVDRLSIDKQAKLTKEGRCIKCKNTRHQENKCPEEDNGKKG